jgi:protein tyrosine phosphatase (PTP) superfamily phosphohydrolase (DUF442 family)
MTIWIENVSAADIMNGRHFDAGPNSMLIQISDPEGSDWGEPWFPQPKFQFKEVHRFSFLDIDFDHIHAITQEQADCIVKLLQKALDERMNVVVHCMAGLCRSGAIAEVGSIMGFVDAEQPKIPNIRVKTMMLRSLDLTYD